MSTRPDPAAVAATLQRVHDKGPLVHCLTNVVVANVTANALLAVGASPAMVENADESAPFAAVASAVLVNLGTLSRERSEAMRAAAASAASAGTPWVLDPVAVGALAHRTVLAADLLEHRPAVVRGNPAEVLGLVGAGGAGRGVDSTVGPEAALEAATALALATGGVVAVSGAVDRVTDGRQVVEVPTGDPLLTRVTGAGCMLGGLVAACLGAGAEPLEAAVGATVALTVAAEEAAASSRGPGSFGVALIDELSCLDEATIARRLSAR